MSPLTRDLSSLPTARAAEGILPDPQPRFVTALVDSFRDADEVDGPRPTAAATRLRHSDAGKCSRALGFTAAGIPKSDPMDAAGTWVTNLGRIVHDAWQQALIHAYGEDNVVAEATCQIDGLDASGHADALITVTCTSCDGEGAWGSGADITEIDDCADCEARGSTRVLYELKTTGGFGYKMMVGERGNAQGPRHSYLLQTALNGLALNVDEVVIGVIAMEAISKNAAAKKRIDEITRFAAEWTYPREQWEPHARAEVKRLSRVLELVDEGRLPPAVIPDPEIPAKARIVDPKTGRWELRDGDDVVDTGTTWNCGYCPFQTTCVKVGGTADVLPIATAREVIGVGEAA